jgi:hypothetical protein
VFTTRGTALYEAMSPAAYKAIDAHLHAALSIAFCSSLRAVFNLHSVTADHLSMHMTERASL